tara:strand:+ start:14731 stop:15078 length:348 start_codon:yes stop_codon:yes gene_type:complete
MAKAWTHKELKECAKIYSTQGSKAACEFTGREKGSVSATMSKFGAKCATRPADSLRPRKRQWYAENIAFIFESLSGGTSRKDIADYLGLNVCSINTAISNARKNGFDAYPPRGSR